MPFRFHFDFTFGLTPNSRRSHFDVNLISREHTGKFSAETQRKMEGAAGRKGKRERIPPSFEMECHQETRRRTRTNKTNRSSDWTQPPTSCHRVLQTTREILPDSANAKSNQPGLPSKTMGTSIAKTIWATIKEPSINNELN